MNRSNDQQSERRARRIRPAALWLCALAYELIVVEIDWGVVESFKVFMGRDDYLLIQQVAQNYFFAMFVLMPIYALGLLCFLSKSVKTSLSIFLLHISFIEDVIYYVMHSSSIPDKLPWIGFFVTLVGKPVTSFELLVWCTSLVAASIIVLILPTRRIVNVPKRMHRHL